MVQISATFPVTSSTVALSAPAKDGAAGFGALLAIGLETQPAGAAPNVSGVNAPAPDGEGLPVPAPPPPAIDFAGMVDALEAQAGTRTAGLPDSGKALPVDAAASTPRQPAQAVRLAEGGAEPDIARAPAAAMVTQPGRDSRLPTLPKLPTLPNLLALPGQRIVRVSPQQEDDTPAEGQSGTTDTAEDTVLPDTAAPQALAAVPVVAIAAAPPTQEAPLRAASGIVSGNAGDRPAARTMKAAARPVLPSPAPEPTMATPAVVESSAPMPGLPAMHTPRVGALPTTPSTAPHAASAASTAAIITLEPTPAAPAGGEIGSYERKRVATPPATALPATQGQPASDLLAQRPATQSPVAEAPHNAVAAEAPFVSTARKDGRVEQPLDTVALPTPVPHPSPAADRAAVAMAPAAPAGDHRVNMPELVDAIARARNDNHTGPVRAAVAHAEFGSVSLQFRTADDGLRVAMTSPDPGFAPAAAAAAAIAAPDGQDARNADARQPDAPSQPALAGDGPAFTRGGDAQTQGGGTRAQPQPRATSQPQSATQAPASRDRDDTTRDGIFA